MTLKIKIHKKKIQISPLMTRSRRTMKTKRMPKMRRKPRIPRRQRMMKRKVKMMKTERTKTKKRRSQLQLSSRNCPSAPQGASE